MVYRARHVRLGTRAAVKVLAGLGPAAAERLERALNTVAELDHPDIAQVYDADLHGEVPYVVTRLGAGDLRSLLGRRGALDPPTASAVLAPVARALDAAQARGLAHGGVKPANVLVEWSPGGAPTHVLLTDFGMPDPGGPAPDALDYVAPERAEGKPPSAAADVYALGCVLYHVLTGRVPLGDVEPPSRVRAGLSRRSTSRSTRDGDDPARRFASCGELLRAFAAATWRPRTAPAPAPVAGTGPGSGRRPGAVRPRRPRRRPEGCAAVVVVASCAALAAVAGYAVSSVVGDDGAPRPRSGTGRRAARGDRRGVAPRSFAAHRRRRRPAGRCARRPPAFRAAAPTRPSSG